jgi:hypothetical protein
MTTLKTPEDWWAEFDAIKDHIREWGPQDQDLQSIIDHPQALRIFGKGTIDLYKENSDLSFWSLMDKLQKERDRRLYHILNSIWAAAPDKPYIHQWKSWHRFCDLCSEGGWILFPELEAVDET